MVERGRCSVDMHLFCNGFECLRRVFIASFGRQPIYGRVFGSCWSVPVRLCNRFFIPIHGHRHYRNAGDIWRPVFAVAPGAWNLWNCLRCKCLSLFVFLVGSRSNAKASWFNNILLKTGNILPSDNLQTHAICKIAHDVFMASWSSQSCEKLRTLNTR